MIEHHIAAPSQERWNQLATTLGELASIILDWHLDTPDCLRLTYGHPLRLSAPLSSLDQTFLLSDLLEQAQAMGASVRLANPAPDQWVASFADRQPFERGPISVIAVSRALLAWHRGKVD
ncbi:hypothetical protein [Deinococcus alpinitundrae]|uniref:hypothetical protein n=1 Tax=Deinococcus alpinitundrae TaxID=468913 RepID=UPI00137999F5|nr:hypothetical protein [Deinococcus alpinitundrae]